MVLNPARPIRSNGRLKPSRESVRMHFVLLLATSLAFPAFGKDPVKLTSAEQEEMRGEIERLSGEIRRLGRRQIWTGVERKYTQLIAIGGSAASDVHLMAAYSARERGDLLEVHVRLLRAAADAPSEAVVDWLYDLDHNFGRVELVADRKRTAELTPAVIPLDPSRRKAVQAAVDTCSSTGRFDGLLPRGDYTFAGQDFKVEPGIGVRVEVSPRARRQGMVQPTIVYQELPQATAKESK